MISGSLLDGALPSANQAGEPGKLKNFPPASLLHAPANAVARISASHQSDISYIFSTMSTISLTRDEAIRRLHTVESKIRGLGVRRLALFGSVLRNEARPDSDVDVLVEFAPNEKTFDRFMALADLLEDTLQHRVEVITTESLSPFIGPHILAEATDVLRAA